MQLVVSVDGAPAADGTEVTASMDGIVSVSGETSGDTLFCEIWGSYQNSGKSIRFHVMGIEANEQDWWEAGGHVDKTFAISITSGPRPPTTPTPIPITTTPTPIPTKWPTPTPTRTPTITPTPTRTPATTPAPLVWRAAPRPHVMQLVVSVDGRPATDGTAITAWLDGEVAAIAATSGGRALMAIQGNANSASGTAIRFRVDGLTANEQDTYEAGGHVDKSFAISVNRRAPPVVIQSQTLQEAFREISGKYVNGDPNLVSVFRWEARTQSWSLYEADPAFASINSLSVVRSGDILWLRVRGNQQYNGKTLYAGWNAIALP